MVFFFSSLTPASRVHADVLNLPVPGAMVDLSPTHEAALIKGLTIRPDNPLMFDFIVDTGHDRLQGEALKKEGEKLAKYFMACLAIPEKDRMVPEALGQTEAKDRVFRRDR